MDHLQQGPEVVIGRLVLHAQLLQLERDLAQALCRKTMLFTSLPASAAGI